MNKEYYIVIIPENIVNTAKLYAIVLKALQYWIITTVAEKYFTCKIRPLKEYHVKGRCMLIHLTHFNCTT